MTIPLAKIDRFFYYHITMEYIVCGRKIRLKNVGGYVVSVQCSEFTCHLYSTFSRKCFYD